MNTFFVFRLKGEATEDLTVAAGSHQKRKRAFRNGDIGALGQQKTMHLVHGFSIYLAWSSVRCFLGR